MRPSAPERLRASLVHFLLRRFQQGIQPAEDDHGQDDVPVFAAHINIAKTIICNGPDKGDEFIMGGCIHTILFLILG